VSEHTPALTVLAGAEQFPVTGRAALVIYLVAANAELVNSEDVGKLVAAFAHGQTKVELRRSLSALKLRPPKARVG
jgi:hypothetical protein